MKKIFPNIFLFIGSFGVGMLLIFSEAIASKILSENEFEGKIEKVIMEDFIAEKFELWTYSSFYSFRYFQPVIVVLGDKDGKKQEIVSNAFTGETLFYRESISPNFQNITFKEYEKKFKEDELIWEQKLQEEQEITEYKSIIKDIEIYLQKEESYIKAIQLQEGRKERENEGENDKIEISQSQKRIKNLLFQKKIQEEAILAVKNRFSIRSMAS